MMKFMRKLNSIKLEHKLIAEIIACSPQKKYPVDSPLFYEGQVPIVAYLLIEGSIQLFKKKKPKRNIKAGTLIGFSEIMNNAPAALSAQVQADSTICFLDKSTILEILQREDSQLASLLEEGEKI